MGRTHPQLPRSSDSHTILEGKACQRCLVLMHPHVPCTLIQGTWSVVWRPYNFHHNPLWPCLLDLEDSGSWGVRGTWLCFCEIGGRTEQIWLHHMMRKAGGAVGTVSLAHVTWEDGQPLLTPGMEVWPEPPHRACLMTRSSLFVSLNTVNLRGFKQILLSLRSTNCASAYTMQDAFPNSW